MGTVLDKNGARQILWWTAGGSITATGSGAFNVDGNLHNMFAPNSTGGDNLTYFETAILKGNITGTGAATTLSVSGDDDVLVYVGGLYVGGVLGVHSTTGTNIDLGNLSGSKSLEIFYADRAQVAADLSVGVEGAVTTGVPETSTWAMLLVGFACLGFAGHRASRKAVAV